MEKIFSENMAKEARMITDELRQYGHMAPRISAKHEAVSHGADEYVRGDVHTDTAEGYYSIFKRGMKGVCQHCGKLHLHRYAAEFDFRYKHRAAKDIKDSVRAQAILRGTEGKRLTYRRTGSGLV